MILSAGGELNSETIYSVTGRGKEDGERKKERWERGYWVLYKEEKNYFEKPLNSFRKL